MLGRNQHMNLDQYEREGRATYAAFAQAVASIVTAAVNRAGGYRLQQVVARAKNPASLRKKLLGRGRAETEQLEAEIKDLAGCRIVFYTNIDVSRFVSSDIVRQNFDVLEVRLHQPGQVVTDVAELYTSNHYILALGKARLSLPEYQSFTGLRCELQVQTILNHAWAETAHDIVYKTPELGAFGASAFEQIKDRMARIARRYLVPAGYELQKVVGDFERLMEGKALFDNNALDAVVDAPDNNVRVEALETLSESVLPLYDELPKIYPAVVAKLLEAAERAKTSTPVTVETPYGALPAKTYSDVLDVVAKILQRYRYADVSTTFHALCNLYLHASSDSERKPLIEVGKVLAKHNLGVWQKYGQAVEDIILDCITELTETTRPQMTGFIAELSEQILSCEVSNETWSSTTLTMQQGALSYSNALDRLRGRTIELLKTQYSICSDDDARNDVVRALLAGTRPPYRGNYSNELMGLILRNTAAVAEFLADMAPSMSFPLRQSAEASVHRLYTMYAQLPASMREDPVLTDGRIQVRAAAQRFRDHANQDQEFVIYKILIGYKSVFPPEWTDEKLSLDAKREYRESEVTNLLGSVSEATADLWYQRLEKCANTESRDLADSTTLLPFLVKLAARQPQVALSYIDRLTGAMERYLPWLVDGLMNSTEAIQVRHRIDAFLESRRHLHHLAWYLRFANPFDVSLLEQVLRRAMESEETSAVRICVAAANMQFSPQRQDLINRVLLPAVEWLAGRNDFGWINAPMVSWYQRPIVLALDEAAATRMLGTLISYPEIDTNADQLIGSIAVNWPAKVIDYLGHRCAIESREDTEERYVATPFAVHELAEPLRAAINLLIAAARLWFQRDPDMFRYRGAYILSAVFPKLDYGLREQFIELVRTGDEPTISFVLNALVAFDGVQELEDIVRIAISRVPGNSELLKTAHDVLQGSGVVHGEYGFVELYTTRRDRINAWLEDSSAQVREFARAQINELDLWIASENRSAEAMRAMRRLSHGENPVDDGPSSNNDPAE